MILSELIVLLTDSLTATEITERNTRIALYWFFPLFILFLIFSFFASTDAKPFWYKYWKKKLPPD